MKKEIILGKTVAEIQGILNNDTNAAIHARKIAYWLYRRQIGQFAEMENLPKSIRFSLEKQYVLGSDMANEVIHSEDGSKKYIYSTTTGIPVESVFLPDGKRKTLCISTQAGCRMGCVLCHTGRIGFHGNLAVHEIINQVRSCPEKASLTHLVFMGMGEPLDNYDNLIKSLEIFTAEWGFAFSTRNITISTVALKPAFESLLKDTHCNISVSLHSPFDDERKKMIPAKNKYSVRELIKIILSHKWEKKSRVTFQYTMIDGFNDTERHLDELIRILKGTKIRINLMGFHTFADCNFESSPEALRWHFKKRLVENGISASIRKSRGEDIGAACGLLGKIIATT